MIEFLRNYLYQKKLKKSRRKHPGRKDLINPGKRIGILCTADKSDDIDAVIRYKEKLERNGKHVKILAYSDTKEEQLHLPFPYFNRKDISWYQAVNGDSLIEFSKADFDLLINLDLENHKPVHFAAHITSARLKVSCFTREEDFYQIMINLGDKPHEISDFLNQISQTLNTLSSGK